MLRYSTVKGALKGWLSAGANYDLFVTVTLKQGLRNDGGSWTRLTDTEAARTLRFLRDRVTKATLGNRRYRAGERLPFCSFREGGEEKRHHFHILVQVPMGMDRQVFEHRFRQAATKLDWVHGQIDFRAATVTDFENNQRMVGYSLKEGVDAFVPEASSFTMAVATDWTR